MACARVIHVPELYNRLDHRSHKVVLGKPLVLVRHSDQVFPRPGVIRFVLYWSDFVFLGFNYEIAADNFIIAYFVSLQCKLKQIAAKTPSM